MCIFKPQREFIYEELKEESKNIQGQTVIDLGCGKIRRYEHLFRNCLYVGIDIDEESDADVLGDAYKLPLKGGCADVVLAIQLFEHLSQPAVALKEIKRILKEGGKLILSVPLLEPIHSYKDYFRYTDKGIEFLLNEAGFAICKLQKVGKSGSVFASLLSRFLINRIFSKRKLLFLRKFVNLFLKTLCYLDKFDKGGEFCVGFFIVSKPSLPQSCPQKEK